MKKEGFILILLHVFTISAFSQEKRMVVKDDPINRAKYEYKRLIDPTTGKIPDKIRIKELEFIQNQNIKSNFKSTKLNKWVHRGPFNLGGRTRALAIDVNNESIILAAGVSGGMWRSADGGISWTKATGSSDIQSVTAIAQDTRIGFTNIWYYATGELAGNSASEGAASFRGNGLFKSVDNGISWAEISSTTANTPEKFSNNFQFCWNVKINPQNGHVFVATYGEILYSANGGNSWQESLNGGNAYATDIAISGSGIIYATLSNNFENEGIFRSTDGISWTNISPANFPSSIRRIVLDIAHVNEDIVYFLANTPGEGLNNHSLWKYKYFSGDGSHANSQWDNLTSQIPDLDGFSGDFDSQNSYDLMLKVKPGNDNFVIIGGINLYRSTDGFKTIGNTSWIGGYTPLNDSYDEYSNHHPDQHTLVFYKSDPNKAISGHDGGLSRTNDISSNYVGEEKVKWTSLNKGYLTSQAYTVAIDNKTIGDNKILAGFQDNGTWSTISVEDFTTWTSEFEGDGSYCAFGQQGLSRYVSSQYGTIYRNIYNQIGELISWARVDPKDANNQLFISPFILDPNDDQIMYYLGGDIIWRNSNLTEISEKSNNPATINWLTLSNSQVVGSTITAIDISKSPANILVYGSANAKLFKIIDASADNPNSIEITGDNFPAGNIGCVMLNPSDPSEIFVTFSNYSIISIWHSVNGGLSWKSISGNLEENEDGSGNGPSIRWISMLKVEHEKNIYFVATSTGLFATSVLDGDNTIWVQESENKIGNVVVSMIKTRGDGTVVVSTHANGVYSAKYDIDTYTPTHKIHANINAKIFPNPSNGVFNIEINGNQPEDYLIAIYDIRGKIVYFSELKKVTSLKQQINLQKHAKGIYNIEIVKDGRASSFKLILK